MENYDERLLHFATAPRLSAGNIQQLTEGRLVLYWIGRLRGKFIKTDSGFKFDNKADAIANAKKFRQQCIDEAKSKGLL